MEEYDSNCAETKRLDLSEVLTDLREKCIILENENKIIETISIVEDRDMGYWVGRIYYYD